jgi:hypothetical protein
MREIATLPASQGKAIASSSTNQLIAAIAAI